MGMGTPPLFSEESSLQEALLALGRACTGNSWVPCLFSRAAPDDPFSRDSLGGPACTKTRPRVLTCPNNAQMQEAQCALSPCFSL